MPRPLLMPLSGGYRRTPVLQIGANVYCDTKIICRGLARHAGDETLYQHGFSAHRAADWADSQLFRVAVALNFRPEALTVMMSQFSAEEAAAFAKDRAELSGDQPIASMSPSAALAYLHHALSELNHSVDGGFLYGGTPCIADFSVYHNLWFLNNNPINAPLLEPYANVVQWMSRMAQFGHGEVIAATGEDALNAAAGAAPQLPALDRRSGDIATEIEVTVTPIDYGCVPVAGRLVAQSHEEVVIARTTPETGEVYTHFPSAGFDVTAA
jgi:glutathione S-transferase